MIRMPQGQRQGQGDKRRMKPAVLFSAEEEQKLVDFLDHNEILYNKRVMDHKDRSKRGLCGISFVRRTIWIKMSAKGGSRVSAHSSKKSLNEVDLGESLLTERQKWTRDNFDFLRDHIMRHLTAKSEFRAPKGSASQASAAAGS